MEDLSTLSDDELEARQRAADGEDLTQTTDEGAAQAEAEAGAAEVKPEAKAADAADATTGTNATTTEAAAQGAGAEEGKADDTKVIGVQSKDGGRVLPYSALQAARKGESRAHRQAERLKSELDAAQKVIEDLKAGKTVEGDLSEADVVAIEENFPEKGAKVRAAFEKAQKASPDAGKQQPKGEDEPSDDPVQEAIDQVPLLLEWQHGDPEKWRSAVAIDEVLKTTPAWRDKSPVERFTEVARRVASDFGIETPPTKSSSAAATAATKPADTAKRKPPETLSDMKGGGVPDHGSIDAARASPRALLNRMQGMSDAELDAHLAKYG